MTITRVHTLSLAERDRRWAAIRSAMAERGLGALIIRGISSKWDSGTANVRYVSQIGGNGEEAIVVFPMTGEPIVLVWAPSQVRWWGEAQSWVKEVRQGSPSWPSKTAQALAELNCDKGRIGVVGIGGRSEAGRIMSYDVFSGIQAALPNAKLEPASDIMEKLRLCKSEEEIGFIERAALLGDIGVQAMLKAARPGVRAYEVYGEILGAVFKAGGESPMFLIFETGKEPHHAVRFPSGEKLDRGDWIIQEISPKFGGYWSQVMVPVCLGKPEPIYRRLAEAAVHGHEAAIQTIRAGIGTRELAEAINRPIKDAGFTAYHPQWQGLGLEQLEEPSDWFTAGGVVTADVRNEELKEGMVLGLQPMASTTDKSKGLQIGATVVVTKTGCRVLGKTKMDLYEI
ncbi:MAG: M24 family metallopeptidase [Alphaproteobacteria bacterium]